VVPPDYAIPDRTHEEARPFATQSSRTHPELFPRSKATFQRCCGGLNNKAKVTMRKPYGFRTSHVLELALYHSLGKLPEPESTHDFF
jgi:transposase